MTFASAFSLILLALFGVAIMAGALNAKRLIAWENRALGSLAGILREQRIALEEERRPVLASAEPVPCAAPSPTHFRNQQGSRAA